MTPRCARAAGAVLATAALGCGSNGGNLYSLPVGDDDGGGGSFAGSDATASGAFDAHIEQNHVTVTIVTLSCAGRCADVEAVATGGQPPYTFAWDDGSASASRQVCPASSTSYFVKVTDTATVGELARAAQTVQVPLTADVIACLDAGAREAGASGDGGSGDGGLCDNGAGVTLPAELTPDINDNTETYFAGGASLPAGRYRISYVSGCIRYDPTIYFWAVNGTFNFEYWLAGATTTDGIQVAPGIVSLGGDLNFDDCVAMSQGLFADITFAGGKLGIYNNDFKPGDNLPGTSGNPTWRLDRLCP
jgi:hypothetical protein